MKVESHNSELPKGFTEWMRLYEQFNWEEIKPNEILEHEQNRIDGYFKWTYTQDYLKARCFDEVMASTYTVEDLQMIISSLHNFGYQDNPAKEKTEKLLKLAYEKEQLEKRRNWI